MKCVFRCSTSNKCYVQVVGTEMVEEQCLEGEGEVIHNFTGLVAGLYIVTVDSGDVSCSANGVADYITVATLREQHFTSHTPSISDTGIVCVCVWSIMGWIIVFSGPILQSKSNGICVKGNVSIVHTAVMDVASYFLKYTVKVNTRIVFLYKHQISSFNSTKSVTPLLFKAHLFKYEAKNYLFPGIGIGVAIGTASASFVFVTVILFIKIISKFRKISKPMWR